MILLLVVLFFISGAKSWISKCCCVLCIYFDSHFLSRARSKLVRSHITPRPSLAPIKQSKSKQTTFVYDLRTLVCTNEFYGATKRLVLFLHAQIAVWRHQNILRMLPQKLRWKLFRMQVFSKYWVLETIFVCTESATAVCLLLPCATVCGLMCISEVQFVCVWLSKLPCGSSGWRKLLGISPY